MTKLKLTKHKVKRVNKIKTNTAIADSSIKSQQPDYAKSRLGYAQSTVEMPQIEVMGWGVLGRG